MPAALCPGRQGGGEDFPPVVLRQEQVRIQEPGSDLPYAGSLLAARNAPSQMLLNTPALFGRKLSFGVQDQRFSYIFAVSHRTEVPFDPIIKPSTPPRLCGDSTSLCREGNRALAQFPRAASLRSISRTGSRAAFQATSGWRFPGRSRRLYLGCRAADVLGGLWSTQRCGVRRLYPRLL